MAGIGFELKKLFRKKGAVNGLKALAYSSLVIIGPSIMCIGLVIIFNILLKNAGVTQINREIFEGTIMYSFIFSVLITSGFSLLLTRYISDKIFVNKMSDVKASLYGALTIITLICGVTALIFYLRSPLDNLYKVCAYILFVELSIEQILCIYVSALKNYKLIMYGFSFGTLASIILEIALINFAGINKLTASIISFDIGVLIITLVLLVEINKQFNAESKKYFEFIRYFKKYYALFFINIFYFGGMYIHNFIFWSEGSINKVLADTYIYAPQYDIPAFFAFITTLITNVMFVVKFETAFSDKWSEYLDNINKGASYKDIELSKENMQSVLKMELSFIAVAQLIISIGSIVIGNKFLSFLGFDQGMKDKFNILTLAYYCIVIMFILVTVLLYFDDRKGALFVTFMFILTNCIFTLVTVFLGDAYYGFGTFLASILVMIIAIYRVMYFVNNIDYYIFCRNSSWFVK